MSDKVRGPFYRQQDPSFRNAIVSELEDVPPYRVRVTFPDRDNMQSWWLPIAVPKIQDDKFYWQPDMGEQVVVLMDANDEDGIVLGSIPSDADQAPSGLTPDIFYIGFKDGTVLQYNRATHVLTVNLVSGGTLTIDGSGNVTINAVNAINLTKAGGPATDALALVSKLVTAFNAHTHSGVASGGGVSGPPEVPWTAATVESDLVKATD